MITSSSGLDHGITELLSSLHDHRMEIVAIVPKDFFDHQSIARTIAELKKGH